MDVCSLCGQHPPSRLVIPNRQVAIFYMEILRMQRSDIMANLVRFDRLWWGGAPVIWCAAHFRRTLNGKAIPNAPPGPASNADVLSTFTARRQVMADERRMRRLSKSDKKGNDAETDSVLLMLCGLCGRPPVEPHVLAPLESVAILKLEILRIPPAKIRLLLQSYKEDWKRHRTVMWCGEHFRKMVDGRPIPDIDAVPRPAIVPSDIRRLSDPIKNDSLPSNTTVETAAMVKEEAGMSVANGQGEVSQAEVDVKPEVNEAMLRDGNGKVKTEELPSNDPLDQQNPSTSGSRRRRKLNLTRSSSPSPPLCVYDEERGIWIVKDEKDAYELPPPANNVVLREAPVVEFERFYEVLPPPAIANELLPPVYKKRRRSRKLREIEEDVVFCVVCGEKKAPNVIYRPFIQSEPFKTKWIQVLTQTPAEARELNERLFYTRGTPMYCGHHFDPIRFLYQQRAILNRTDRRPVLRPRKPRYTIASSSSAQPSDRSANAVAPSEVQQRIDLANEKLFEEKLQDRLDAEFAEDRRLFPDCNYDLALGELSVKHKPVRRQQMVHAAREVLLAERTLFDVRRSYGLPSHVLIQYVEEVRKLSRLNWWSDQERMLEARSRRTIEDPNGFERSFESAQPDDSDNEVHVKEEVKSEVEEIGYGAYG